MIANEFTEATGELYLSALIELGLVLFLITSDPERPRAARSFVATERRWRSSDEPRAPAVAKIVERRDAHPHRASLPCSVVSILFLILGYLVYNGGKSLNWDFFTKLPTPVGETGGGMANAIVGSLKLLLLAAVIGVPVGLLAGVYLAEFGGRTFSFLVRYTTDLLNGVPSIVMGIFAYTLVVLPMQHFSTLAGGVALGVMMIPITVRSTEAVLARGSAIVARRRDGARRKQVEDDCHGRDSGGARGASSPACCWHSPASRAKPRLSLFTAFGNQFWSPGWNQPIASLPGDDLYVRDCAVRRLASPGLGCWIGTFGYGADCERRHQAGREPRRSFSECLIWLLPQQGHNSATPHRLRCA